jgi:hypothetical protein
VKLQNIFLGAFLRIRIQVANPPTKFSNYSLGNSKPTIFKRAVYVLVGVKNISSESTLLRLKCR